MTELSKEELLEIFVAKYLAAIKDNDVEGMVGLAATVTAEDREATLKAILAAAEKDDDIRENAGDILDQLKLADNVNDEVAVEAAANAEAKVEVQAPSISVGEPADSEPAVA